MSSHWSSYWPLLQALPSNSSWPSVTMATTSSVSCLSTRIRYQPSNLFSIYSRTLWYWSPSFTQIRTQHKEAYSCAHPIGGFLFADLCLHSGLCIHSSYQCSFCLSILGWASIQLCSRPILTSLRDFIVPYIASIAFGLICIGLWVRRLPLDGRRFKF